jgi:hypothetical protein
MPEFHYFKIDLGWSELNCPKCGLELVVRTNSQSGANFYGCKGFPKCKHSQSMTQTVTGSRQTSNDGIPSLDDLAQDWGWDNWQAFDESRE